MLEAEAGAGAGSGAGAGAVPPLTETLLVGNGHAALGVNKWISAS